MYTVLIAHSPAYAGTVVTIIAKRSDGYHQVLPFNLTFSPIEPGIQTSPCLVFSDEEEGKALLKALAEGLAKSGYFPDIIQNAQSELTATKYHLEDMRKLVFKKELEV